jgi:7-cyano-7-deazaguanine synthase in queuosine biosynthesis
MKVLLLNGGGVDTLACAIILQASGHEAHSLHIDFGYPNSASCKVAAEIIATTHCVDHKVITVQGLDPMGFDPVINDRYRPVQYQQLILSGIGSSHAQINGFTHVVSGFRHHFLTNQFKDLFNQLLSQVRLHYINPIRVDHPLAGITTDQALFDIMKGSAILHDTVSCLFDPPCRTCSKCKFRSQFGI